ncbi:MAG: tRNA (uridine(34)/cytosine(34)/5-carboxymethylaminomethyluridine(34)-2'-O)-methyltransferase TrmL [Gammaproteobacteria bacterium]|nr:tRNA (uridine(34)/cytosine(34)/5-carboxymethylaminomethyluridine(34)-2'-O)-methyltransferase TrmL [Gammaproteobacteria bacterium]
MFHIVLFEPEIPPNTGNIMRLCANAGSALHLIEPLGFELDDRRLKRAGLDYRDTVNIRVYRDMREFIESVRPARLFACSTKGRNTYSNVRFCASDAFLFGPETRGLPLRMLENLPSERRLRIPMTAGSRSLNLSNAVAIVLFEAWRQCGFTGAIDHSGQEFKSDDTRPDHPP